MTELPFGVRSEGAVSCTDVVVTVDGAITRPKIFGGAAKLGSANAVSANATTRRTIADAGHAGIPHSCLEPDRGTAPPRLARESVNV